MANARPGGCCCGPKATPLDAVYGFVWSTNNAEVNEHIFPGDTYFAIYPDLIIPTAPAVPSPSTFLIAPKATLTGTPFYVIWGVDEATNVTLFRRFTDPLSTMQAQFNAVIPPGPQTNYLVSNAHKPSGEFDGFPNAEFVGEIHLVTSTGNTLLAQVTRASGWTGPGLTNIVTGARPTATLNYIVPPGGGRLLIIANNYDIDAFSDLTTIGFVLCIQSPGDSPI